MSLSAERAIREAVRESQGGDEESSSISVGDTSMRNVEVDDHGGGSSRLGKGALGSAALQAALTLHPCVHVSGCGDASQEVLHSMLSTCGPCVVRTFGDSDDEDRGAACTFESAADALSAIERFDGSRFDDGVLVVTASRNAAQGSLTRRGRGRNSHKMTFHDQQRERMSRERIEQAQSEKAAFAQARERMIGSASAPSLRGLPTIPLGPSLPPTATQAPASAAQPAKRKVAAAKLPSFLVSKVAKAPAVSEAAADSDGASVKLARTAAPKSDQGSDGEPPVNLLGLGGYDSDSES